MAKRLDQCYQIVLVGTNSVIDKQLPDNIISIHHTQNQRELAECYTAADVFANPTREEMLGLVNLEALACGTPVVTFQTGGCPECIDATCGTVVPYNGVDAMESEIKRICDERPYSAQACIKRAQYFAQQEKYRQYIGLYREE